VPGLCFINGRKDNLHDFCVLIRRKNNPHGILSHLTDRQVRRENSDEKKIDLKN
jgi:hypothetical protein